MDFDPRDYCDERDPRDRDRDERDRDHDDDGLGTTRKAPTVASDRLSEPRRVYSLAHRPDRDGLRGHVRRAGHGAYEREAARLEARDLEIERVRLDYELKREYRAICVMATSVISENRGSSKRFAFLAIANRAVVLTERGRGLLEANRDRERDTGQTFYSGLKRGAMAPRA